MQSAHKKLEAELEALKESWLPLKMQEVESRVTDQIQKLLASGFHGFEDQLKDLIDGRVQVAVGHAATSIKSTVGEVTSAQFTAIEQQLQALAATGGAACPCVNGQCPCPCRGHGAEVRPGGAVQGQV